ncbi:AAA family ATPase [Streptomyces sp. FXY-T5]|uniref:AAA family ATPase n=1 Tax=Streptomyces sp. FXY-T5 TaxID=3064901 RepID=UPI0027D265C1|nr:AAA family ATPase [Streptomyces sp. FXY-T5]WMD05617.1 AAA family ATPase [Streptomyces sp. FXY-T5]
MVDGEWSPTSEGLLPLPSVEPQVRELAAVLSRFDGLNVSEPLIDADWVSVKESWRHLRHDSVGRPRIVHFAGHGVSRGRVLYLPVHDSRPTDLPQSAIDVGRWLNEVEHGSDQSPVLFLLDVCGAGAATDYQLFQDVPEGDRKTWVIAACTADESAFDARFTKATAQALERLCLGHWDISPTLSHVPVEAVADEIARELVRLGEGYPQTVVHSPRRAASLPVPEFFANPAFSTDGWQRLRSRLRFAVRELAAEFDPGLDPVHFLTRASGRLDDAAAMTGCLFTGRTRELTQIRSWLASDEPLLLVTGSPGAGKSALLGVTVFLSHNQLAELSTGLVGRIRAQYRPERRYATLVAVHARHRSTDEVIASITVQLSPEDAEPAAASSEQALDELKRIAQDLPEPVVLILDAIDEALESGRIARYLLPELLRTLRSDGRPAFRALVGMRPPQADGHRFCEVPGDHAMVLDLDTSSNVEDLADDLTTYIADILYSAPGYNDQALRESVARAVATEIAHSPDRSTFLVAALFADFLRTGAPLNPSEAVAQLPQNLPHLLELHLRTTLDGDPWMRHLMVGLAQARGQGMPLELVAAAATAAAMATGQELRPLTPGEAREKLATARFYLRTNIDSDGRQLYRFFHETITEHFRDTGAELDGLADTLFHELLSAVPGRWAAEGPRWDLTAPYLLRHLMEHAAAVPSGSAVDQLFLDPEYLVRADHAGIWEAVHRTKTPTARRAGVAYRKAFGRSDLGSLFGQRIPLETRRARLQQSLVTYQAAGLARRLHDERTPLRTHWSTGLPEESLLYVISEDELGATVSALALGAVDRQLLAVFGGTDGSLQAWDITPSPDSAVQYFSAPRTDKGAITQMAIADLDERAVIASVTDQNALLLYDLATGALVADTRLDGARVSALAVVGTGDETALAVGRVSGEISLVGLLGESFGRILDTVEAGGAAIGSLLGVESTDGSLAFHCVSAEPQGHGPRVLRNLGEQPVTISSEGPLQEVRIQPTNARTPLFSLIAYQPSMYAVRGNGETVHVVTGAKDRGLTLADIRHVDRFQLALTAHRDGNMRVWDLDVCPQFGHGQNHWHPATILGTIRLGGSELVLSAELASGEIKAWDLSTGAEDHELTDLGELSHAATMTAGDASYVVTVTTENELDTWNVREDALESTVRLPAPATALAAVPHGDSVWAVVGGADGDIHVWDTRKESPSHVLTGVDGPVTELVAGDVGGESLLISVHNERRVCLWSLADGTLRQSITLDQIGAVALQGGRLFAAEQSSDDDQVRIWDLVTASLVGSVSVASPQVMTVSQVNGRPVLVAAVNEAEVQAWDAESGDPLGSPAPVPDRVHTIAPYESGVLVGSMAGHVTALGWACSTAASALRPTQPTVHVTHVLAWLPGELLCGDARADGWELYTVDEWEGGLPPSFGLVYARPLTATTAELHDALVDVLTPDGFEVVRLEAHWYEISKVNGVTNGGPWRFPAYSVHCHSEEGPEQ